MRRSMIAAGVVTGIVLLVPLIAMQFTREVAWGAGDFLVAGVLLFSAGMGMILGARRMRTTAAKVAVVAGIGAALLLVWAELAVGVFT